MEKKEIQIISQKDGVLTIGLSGRITSENAADIEQSLLSLLEKHSDPDHSQLVLDFSHLSYLSSAGLRILMKLVKSHPGLKIIEADKDIVDVLEMTGISSLIPVTRKMRKISLDHLEKLGEGFHGAAYKLDVETIIKVLNDTDLEAIERERNLAQKAFLLEVPTAISFDVIQADDRYGIIYELLEGRLFQQEMEENREKIEDYGKIFGNLAKRLHTIEIPEKSRDFPDAKKSFQPSLSH